ncbi:hypothetical protein GFJ94_08365 [Flavobacterium sp. LMO8]|uniref:hypothetical protein n=1 Tax=Flavobacterium sp. LMO8 TaxID=2654244 RepID=UPI00129268E9|nr:hypothetical protein [Flavobacterium sp. LMO8]MQP25077.1 hypothetical protein [Flavobacterium sp. LMO8]
MNKIIIIAISFIFYNCACQERSIAVENLSASYESWVAGVRGGGSGINFYVDLKTELSKEIELKKVIFRGYEVPFEKQDNFHFIARIKTEGNQQKFDGDDSQIYTSPKNALTLAENEAILIFLKNGKEIRQTIKEVKEKPMLLYPSAKPKN